MLATAPYIRPGHIPAADRKPAPKLLPAAYYDVSKHAVLIYNGYSVREVLKAAGYGWDGGPMKTWSKKQPLEAFRDELPTLEAVGVKADEQTVHLLAINAKPAPATATSVQPVPVKETAPVADQPEPVLSDEQKLRRARAFIVFIADSERVPLDLEARMNLKDAINLIGEVIKGKAPESVQVLAQPDSDYTAALLDGAEWA